MVAKTMVEPVFSDEDSDLREVRWYSWRGYPAGYGASRRSGLKYRKLLVKAHRVVLSRMIGRELVKGEECDHINGNKLDSRRENLRLVDRFGNMQNRRLGPYRGTHWNKKDKRWRAVVKHKGKSYHLGNFKCREKAAAASAAKRAELGFLHDKAN